MLRVVVVERLTVHDVALLNGEGRRAEHAHLLGLAVVDRRLSPERVEVIVGEGFLRHRRRGRGHVLAHRLGGHAPDDLADAVQIAGDELQRRVLERRAAAVDHGHPAVDVGGLVVARDGQHVVRVPRQLAREVRGLDAVACAARVVERPDQRRARVEIAGQLRKPDVIGLHARDDLAADLPDGRVVVAEQARGHVLLARRVVGPPRAHQRDVAADVLAQQLVGLEQVVLVVLFEHAHARRLAERPEVHRRRIDGRGDVHEVQIGGAAGNLQVADVAHERDVGVVDGDGEFRLVVERGRRGRILCRARARRLAEAAVCADRVRESTCRRPTREGRTRVSAVWLTRWTVTWERLLSL